MLGPHEADPNREAEIKRMQKQAKENNGVTDWGDLKGSAQAQHEQHVKEKK